MADPLFPRNNPGNLPTEIDAKRLAKTVAQRLLTSVDQMVNEWCRWGAPVTTHRDSDQVLTVSVDDIVLEVRVSVRK